MTSSGTVGLIKLCQANRNSVSIETKYSSTRIGGYPTTQDTKWGEPMET